MTKQAERAKRYRARKREARVAEGTPPLVWLETESVTHPTTSGVPSGDLPSDHAGIPPDGNRHAMAVVCCLDRGAEWRRTPCLCSCHYPTVTAREMLEDPERWSITKAEG